MTDADQLAPLELLLAIPGGPTAYYRAAVAYPDRYLRVSAWCRLLEVDAVEQSQWPSLLEACRDGAVAKAAFDYFERQFEHELARRASQQAGNSLSALRQEAFRARAELDHDATTEVQAAYFLDTDEVGHLVNAATSAELAGGWQRSLPWSVRAVVIAPLVPDLWGRLLLLLSDSQQGELLARALAYLQRLGQHAELLTLFGASLKLLSGDPQACLDTLVGLDGPTVAASPALQLLHSRICTLRVEAQHSLGRYREAYAAIVQRQQVEKRADIRAEDFGNGVRARSRLVIPALPPDPRNDTSMMLGFPRSGTTLLENALGTHPLIETFEEIPAQFAMLTRLKREVTAAGGDPDRVASAFVSGREAYYQEIDIRRRKPEAQVLIDKLPIASAEAYLYKRTFPDRRYVFSIRHPFDVVLSCMRQSFRQNAAMANFLSLSSAVAAYDLAMSQWFANFSRPDPAVFYIRYDDLVMEFEPTLRGALSFLGLEWDPTMADFAARAQRRSARTPSYAKVRQGLSIGVQTSWRNYDFLFNTPEAKPLHKWAEFFGYPTQ